MANKKSTKNANVKEKAIEVEEVIATETEIVETEAVEEPVIETEEVPAIEVEEPKVEEKKDTAKYEVILATPTYYIINKNGVNKTIKEINNYKKGDLVTL
jgi:preprotein translocase subunit SecD